MKRMGNYLMNAPCVPICVREHIKASRKITSTWVTLLPILQVLGGAEGGGAKYKYHAWDLSFVNG